MERAPRTIAGRGSTHHRRHVAVALLAGAAAITTAVGCGGDDRTAGTSAATVTSAASATTGASAPHAPATGTADSTPASDPMLPTGPSADTDPAQGSSPPAAAGGEPVGSDHTVFERGDIDRGLQPFVDRAVADLAARLDVDPGDIDLLTAVLVVWPNSALGCPDPKLRYTQVPVDGSVIELGVGDRVYRYHTGGASELFLCARPWNDSPAAGGPSRVETNAPDATGDDG